MATDYKIIWSPQAEQALADELSYVETHWGTKVANNFLRKINSNEQTIARDPEMYAFAPEAPDYHKCVVGKHAVIYYKFENDIVKIHSLWDPRQDPDKLNLE
jgi:plasmid stabilization system protein ParE